MNESLFRFLNNFALRNEFFDTLVVFCAVFLGWWLVLGIIVFLFRERWENTKLFITPSWKHARELSVIFFTALCAWGLAEFLKELVFYNPRPYEVSFENIHVLLTNGSMDSFPSGHATFFFALATGLYFYHKKLGALYFLGAFLIGFSRIIAGIHWPFDIMGGYVLGGLVAFAVFYFYRREKLE